MKLFQCFLSKDFAYELCVGQNGRVWLSAPTARETVLLLQVGLPGVHSPIAMAGMAICSMVSGSGDQEKLWDDQCSNRSLGPSVFLRAPDLERDGKLRQWWARWWRCSPDC